MLSLIMLGLVGAAAAQEATSPATLDEFPTAATALDEALATTPGFNDEVPTAAVTALDEALTTPGAFDEPPTTAVIANDEELFPTTAQSVVLLQDAVKAGVITQQEVLSMTMNEVASISAETEQEKDLTLGEMASMVGVSKEAIGDMSLDEIMKSGNFSMTPQDVMTLRINEDALEDMKKNTTQDDETRALFSGIYPEEMLPRGGRSFPRGVPVKHLIAIRKLQYLLKANEAEILKRTGSDEALAGLHRTYGGKDGKIPKPLWSKFYHEKLVPYMKSLNMKPVTEDMWMGISNKDYIGIQEHMFPTLFSMTTEPIYDSLAAALFSGFDFNKDGFLARQGQQAFRRSPVFLDFKNIPLATPAQYSKLFKDIEASEGRPAVCKIITSITVTLEFQLKFPRGANFAC